MARRPAAAAATRCHTLLPPARTQVHRDLKPENCLIDHRTGYLKLCDFGFAKVLKAGERTFSYVGTPDYMAPEIACHRGHTFAVVPRTKSPGSFRPGSLFILSCCFLPVLLRSRSFQWLRRCLFSF